MTDSEAARGGDAAHPDSTRTEPRSGPLSRVPERSSGDHLLRSLQMHHVQLSAMADTKANIIITVSSIVLTLALGRLADAELRPALLVLCAFTLLALLLAVLAVLPKYRDARTPADPHQGGFNLLFFGHFTRLDEARYLDEMARALMPGRAYETVLRDVYGLGTFLMRHKYPYLRLSYLFFLAGFVAALLVQVSTLVS